MTAKISKFPTSAKQAAANRANARHSTGPRTLAGKAIAARNALAHGLCAAAMPVLPDEDAGVFKEFHRRLVEDLAPDGMLECGIVERIAVLQWRLARAGRIEAAIFALEHARRAHAQAKERVKETDPGSMPDWDWLRDNPPPGQIWIEDDDAPHVIEAAKDWNAEMATHKTSVLIRDAAWERYRGMTEAATFSHFMHQPQALETLSRYEIGLYRQLEAVLRQFWLVAGRRPRRPMEPPEIIQEASPAPDDDPTT